MVIKGNWTTEWLIIEVRSSDGSPPYGALARDRPCGDGDSGPMRAVVTARSRTADERARHRSGVQSASCQGNVGDSLKRRSRWVSAGRRETGAGWNAGAAGSRDRSSGDAGSARGGYDTPGTVAKAVADALPGAETLPLRTFRLWRPAVGSRSDDARVYIIYRGAPSCGRLCGRAKLSLAAVTVLRECHLPC